MGDGGSRESKVALKTVVATNGRKKMIMAKQMTKKEVTKRRKRKRRDLAAEIGAKNVGYWGTGKQLAKKMKLKRGKPYTSISFILVSN